MKKNKNFSIWKNVKRKISILLIICMIVPNFSNTSVYAKESMYKFVNELEIDETYIDDDMFYMPYSTLEVDENDSKYKYLIKIKRKGNAEKAEKVKLSMIDVSAKYNRDYSIKVIDKAFFSENVKNINVSKNVNEIMQGEYNEYNFSDAIIDGTINSDNVLSEEEKNNAKVSDEDKEKLINDANNLLDQFDMSADLSPIDNSKVKVEYEIEAEDDKNADNEIETDDKIESNNETKIDNDTKTIDNKNEEESISEDERTVLIDNIKETVSGFTNSDSENPMTNLTNNDEEESAEKETIIVGSDEEESLNVESVLEENDEVDTTIKELSVEEPTEKSTEESTTEEATEESTIEEPAEKSTEEPKEESITEESTTKEESTEKSNSEESTIKELTIEELTVEESTKIESITKESITDEQTNEESTSITIQIDDDKKTTKSNTPTEINESEPNVASDSEIVYGSEEVKFDVKRASLSAAEAFEIATGLKDDKVPVKPDMSMNIMGLNPNSLEDKAYMRDSIEIIEEELKSAYVILEFKEQQSEKTIEISILNDKKYCGDRQVGFSLSSVDGSQVAGMYANMTFIIHDDEEEAPTYINFSKTHYEPKDGYFTIEIERSGAMSSIATCMLDSEDMTAVGGRDYSKVHAELMFGFGINKRTVKIPAVSSFINDTVAFKLKLQEAKGALIGDNATAICNIKKTDISFKFIEEKLKSFEGGSNKLFGANPPTVSLDTSANGIDYDLDSIIYSDPINLEKYVYNFESKNANKSSEHYFINNGEGMHLYLENHSFSGETATYKWDVDAREDGLDRYDCSGFGITWSCNRENADITIKEFKSNGDWHTLYDKNREDWGTRTDNFFFVEPLFNYLSFKLNRYDGMWRKSPTLQIESIKPILRMYEIKLLASDVPSLIDEEGHPGSHRYDNYAITSIDGEKTDHTGVGWAGKKVTVRLNNAINNPFYIKSLHIVNESGTVSKEIAKNDDTSATTITFELNRDFVFNYNDMIKSIDRPNGAPGKNGQFYLRAELGTKPSTIKVVKDNRVNIDIWGTNPKSSTEEANTWIYNIGDAIRFNAQMKSKAYRCDGLNIYKVNPYSPNYITIHCPIDGGNYFPYDAEITEIRVEPLISRNDNVVTVKVKKDLVDGGYFDTSYGIFNTATKESEGNYYNYIITNNGERVCGKYFDIKAHCSESYFDNYIPVWTEVNKDQVRYAQNEYYFLGNENAENNIIYLTVEKADDMNYQITGNAYYEETPIGGKTIDAYWQAAQYIGVIVDDLHFCLSDANGVFATMPGKGKLGYYYKYKVVSNGSDIYMTTKLNQDKVITEGKDKWYSVIADDILISNTTNLHPHVTGVKVTDFNGKSYGEVYINDKPTKLTAYVIATSSDGSYYKYSYIDENGVERTEDEHVKRIEFVVVDMKSHKIKSVIEATRSNADKTEWTVSYNFERGHYSEYQSDDKLYVRIVTDRKIGNGTGGGSPVDIFNETTYQAISTSFPFIEQAEQEPVLVNVNFLDEDATANNSNGLKFSLPIIGQLSTLINAQGMSFRMEVNGDRIRFFIGKKLNGKGNHYDGNGNPVSDTGYAINLDNFDEGMQDMTDMINNSGKQRLGTMTLGVPGWDIKPIAGVYLEFMMSYDPSAVIENKFAFSGGGGYLGGILDLKYTFYFLVYGVPCFVGGDLNLKLVGEFGVAVNPEKPTQYFDDMSQSFMNGLLDNSHFEFLFRATLIASAYAGVGICGVASVRGGFELTLKFIYNPFIKKTYPNVRELGFAVTGCIKIWVDAILIKIPIPVYEWPRPYNLGYFEDIKNVLPSNNSMSSNNEVDNVDGDDMPLEPKPRQTGDSQFVANENAPTGLFGGTFVEDGTRTLIDNVYDAAEPKLMKISNDKALLIYLDDDQTRSDLDRTVLKYMIYDSTNTVAPWSTPKKVWSIDSGAPIEKNTADFNPHLCDCGDKVLISWSSRPDEVSNNSIDKNLLSDMEIYTAFFDKTSEQFENFERLTNDNHYDYSPMASYDEKTGMIYLYYLKKMHVTDINTRADMINQILTEANGAYLMYMLYDTNPTTGNKEWLKQFYYDYEIASTGAAREAYIEEFKGQRFKNLSIANIVGTTSEPTPGSSNPNINEFVTSTVNMFDITEVDSADVESVKAAVESSGVPSASSIPEIKTQMLEFKNNHSDKIKNYNVVGYVVEKAGGDNTKDSTDIYLKIHAATESESKTIRVTNNNVPDLSPKMIKNNNTTYLFWIQNNTMIKMLDINNLIAKSVDEYAEFSIQDKNKDIKAGEVNIVTTDKLIMNGKINNIYPFVDSDNNIYVVWQQDSNSLNNNNQTGTIEFKQDLYIAGLIETNNGGSEITRSWSNPVRLTDNKKVNDLPSIVDMKSGGNKKLLFVNNQYKMKSETGNDSYEISDSKLQEITFKGASSMEMVAVNPMVVSANEDGSITYRAEVKLQNTGLYAAKGYSYIGNFTYDGMNLAQIPIQYVDETILPGATAIIGGKSPSGITTPEIYFTLSREQQKHIEDVKITLTVKETEIVDDGKRTTLNVFNINKKFDFIPSNIDGSVNADKGSIDVKQIGDSFVIDGILKNNGNTHSSGNEKIYVIKQDDWDHPIASSSYIDLPIHRQMHFTLPIHESVLYGNNKGIDDLVVCVMNDEGKIISDYELATLNAKVPYNFKVNGGVDKIQVKVGETIQLNTTYEPSERYKNATILYTIDDANLAKVTDNSIVGVAEGTTKLRLTTKEFGGSKYVDIEVTEAPTPPPGPKPKPTPGPGPSGGGGGGGGGGGVLPSTNPNSVPSVTEVPVVKLQIPPVDASNVAWEFDPLANKFKLRVSLNGQMVPAQNIFVTINETEIQKGEGIQILKESKSTYFFDSNGNMVTGWIKTADNKWYFFENEKTIDEGKMVLGWKQIQNEWYYFDIDGSMLINAVTPDGFIVGADGRYIK